MPNKAELLAGLIDANGDVLADNLDNVSVAFADVTSKPTTLAGYGITDAATSAQGTNADTAYGWGDHSAQGYATTTYVDTSVSNLVAAAPTTLDTLNELAAALGDDANFSTTVTNSLAAKAALSGANFTGNVTTTGNVGIGTASPARTVHISSATPILKLQDSDSTGSAIVSFVEFSDSANAQAGYVGYGGSSSSDFSIRNNLSGGELALIANNSEAMRINSSGNVGIGTDSPDQTLHVHKGSAGTVASTADSVLTLENSSNAILQFLTPATSNAMVRFGDPSDNGAGFINYDHSTNQLSFGVNGPTRFLMEGDGDFHADGDVIAYSTTISDERLKTNIQGIENAVAKVSQLNGYTFEYKADGKVSAGVIAQEVESVLPEAVSEKQLPLKTDDDQEYKVVNYDALHGLLIEAVKELAARVEALEAK